ncbi:MAG: alpha/beta hydrolase [bacterium]
MSEMAVMIPHNDGWLAADLNLGNDHAVIFLPGWSGTRYGPQRILLQAARNAATSGFTTLRLDYHGRGDSSDITEVTLDGMITDAITAITWLRTEHNIAKISLVGLCSGGNVALGVASLDKSVSKVVCWSLLPFMEDKKQIAKQGTPRKAMLVQYLRKIFRLQTWQKLFHGELNMKGAQESLVKDKEGDADEKTRKTSKRTIMRELIGFAGSVYLLYGSRDPESAGSRTFFTSWFHQHNINNVERTIEGAPHNFYTALWTAEVAAQTARWLAE